MTPRKTDTKPHTPENALISACCQVLISAVLTAILAIAIALCWGCSARKTTATSETAATARTEQLCVESARTKQTVSDSLRTSQKSHTSHSSQGMETTHASKTIDITRDSAGRPSRISITESGQTRKAATVATSGRSDIATSGITDLYRSEHKSSKSVSKSESESGTKTETKEKDSGTPGKTGTVIAIIFGGLVAAYLLRMIDDIRGRRKKK